MLANDAFGSYPLFIFHDNNYFIFCTEYEPITKYRYFNKELDKNAIAEYYCLGQPTSDKTFFSKIKYLEPGSVLMIDSTGVEHKIYDSKNIDIDMNIGTKNFAEDLNSLVRAATKIRIKNPNAIKVSLTGGTDSRLIMGCMSDSQRESFSFFTNGSPYVSNDNNREIIISRMLAEKYNLNHTVINIEKPKNTHFGVTYLNKTRISNFNFIQPVMGWGGGEFVGGGCFDSDMNLFKASKKVTDNLFSKIFSKEFKRTTGATPYLSVMEHIEAQEAENKELILNIYLYSRGFYSSRFKENRTWLQP